MSRAYLYAERNIMTTNRDKNLNSFSFMGVMALIMLAISLFFMFIYPMVKIEFSFIKLVFALISAIGSVTAWVYGLIAFFRFILYHHFSEKVDDIDKVLDELDESELEHS